MLRVGTLGISWSDTVWIEIIRQRTKVTLIGYLRDGFRIRKGLLHLGKQIWVYGHPDRG